MERFGDVPIAVWGSQVGPKNRSNFETMSPGDDVLIVEGNSVRLIGKIAAKVESEGLSRELWKPITGTGGTTWQLIYFIANPRELDLPFQEFCRLFGYDDSYRLRGFTSVAPNRLERFYSKYDDLYSVAAPPGVQTSGAGSKSQVSVVRNDRRDRRLFLGVQFRIEC